jgi:nicotinamide mononucleotide transporter
LKFSASISKTCAKVRLANEKKTEIYHHLFKTSVNCTKFASIMWQTSPIEVIAALLGALSVLLVIRRNILAFPIGIVMVLLYVQIFYESKLYSDMLLQVFFAVMQLQGWYLWKQNAKENDAKINVRTLSNLQWIWTGVIQFFGFLALGYAMQTYTDAASPYTDAFVTVQSVLAQWWMNKRYLENWILLIGVNQVAIFLYASKGLYFTTGLYGLFLVMSVIGYLEWRDKMEGKSLIN